jgi:large subunit ribosomal protein L19e
MNLKNQRRLASEILKIGANRVWIDPERTEDVEGAITRGDIRKLIHEKAIQAIPKKGVSRGRARVLQDKKRVGRRKGPGSKTGRRTARMPRKKMWERRIRTLRAHLKELRMRRAIRKDVYRRLYLMAKGGAFSTRSQIDQYIEMNKLARRR